MSRQARNKSKTEIYHVMLRGNEGKTIFIDEEDKNRIVDIRLLRNGHHEGDDDAYLEISLNNVTERANEIVKEFLKQNAMGKRRLEEKRKSGAIS